MNTMLARILFLLVIVSSTTALAQTRVLEPFDSQWTQRWWGHQEGGFSCSIQQKAIAAGKTGYLDIQTHGAGYAILQSKPELMARMDLHSQRVPSGLTFRISGGKAGSFVVFEVGGNRKVKIPFDGKREWKTVSVPFSDFSPALSYEELKKAGFVQINLFGDMNFRLGAISWIFPKKFDATTLAELELANLMLKPNLEYNPLLIKCGGQEKQLRLAIQDDNTGWIETADVPGKQPGTVGAFGCEVDGKFDEGGCPDWTQVHGVTIVAKANKPATMQLEFLREGETVPLASAPFTIQPEFTAIQIPLDAFDKELSNGIGTCRITMPDGVDLSIKRIGVMVPEGLYQEEMKRRGAKNVRYYRWRREVFETQGLTVGLFNRAIDNFANRVQLGDFGQYDSQKNEIDRLYWYGIELLGLRAMNRANLDRAEALQDAALMQESKDNGAKIDEIVASLADAKDTPSLDTLYARENTLAEKTMALVREKNLKPYVKGRNFYSPAGKPIHFFGPHSFTASRKGMIMRQDIGFDLMYKRLAALGYNGIRFEAEENRLMPAEDVLDETTVQNYRQAIETAGKYGLWVQYDNHFYFPAWVSAGSKEFPNPHPMGSANSYHNLGGTLKVWDATARIMKDMNNIFVFETPSNEPFFYEIPRSILDIPSMMHEWNQFLKRKYGTRENLNDAWTRNVEWPKENQLQASEDWDKDTINPPGFSEATLADMKNQSARIWDWMEFVKHLQGKTTGDIAKTVRTVIPSATFMQQFMIGNEWDHCPIPMNYQAIVQVRSDESIFIGSHYGVAGKQVIKAKALGTPTTDSENPGEDNYGSYLRQKLLGGGATVFADFARWGGGMLWENDSGDYKESTAYVPLIADFFVNAEPLYTEPQPQVVVIEPTRLAMTQQNDSINEILAILEKSDVAYHLFEEHYVIDHPDILKNYKAAIVNITQCNTQLLDILKGQTLKVFLFGSPLKDAYTRVYPEGILGWFEKNKILLQSVPVSAAGQSTTGATTLNMEGNIKFKYDDKKTAQAEKWFSPEYDDSKWDIKPVPGYWGELEILGSRKYFLGEGWYRFHVRIPADWEKKDIVFRMGAVDDTDELYVNGTPVAQTTTTTPNWWQAPRNYSIPNDVLRFGQENVFAVKVVNTLDDAGIYKSPVCLSTRDTIPCTLAQDVGFYTKGDALGMVQSPEHYYPAKADLTESANVLAGNAQTAAMTQDGNFILCSMFLQIGQTAGYEKMLLSFLKDAGLDVTYPVPNTPKIYPFTKGYYIVRGAADSDAIIHIQGNQYKHVGIEVLKHPTRRDDGYEFTVPRNTLCLIRVW